MGKPRLPDIDTLRAMGFNPTMIDKLCGYLGNTDSFDRVAAIKKVLRKNDRQQFTRRYVWENLPNDLTGDYIERVLYYKYSAIFFYIPELNTFNFLPYVGTGLDEKGRYTRCRPLPFNGKSEKDADGDKQVYIPGLEFSPIYDITKTDPRVEMDYAGKENLVNPMLNGCVILNSYCKELSQRAIPEQALIDPILDMMAEAMPLARTKLIASAGTTGMRVGNEDEQANVEAANLSIERAALNGKRFIPVVGVTEFQEFANDNGADAEIFMRYMTELDNLRLQSYGLKNNGLFEKNSYVNETMAGNIQVNVGQIYEDGLKLRQDFCDFVNATWGLGISCSASETVTNSDTNMDGETLDDNQTQQVAPDEQQAIGDVE